MNLYDLEETSKLAQDLKTIVLKADDLFPSLMDVKEESFYLFIWGFWFVFIRR